jgi:hypothetical protein
MSESTITYWNSQSRVNEDKWKQVKSPDGVDDIDSKVFVECLLKEY